MHKQEFVKELTTGIDGKKKLLEGLRKSCDIVSSTMGSRGKNNIFEQFSGIPLITSDGRDSLEQLYWDDPIERIALNILKEAVEKTFKLIGDGTTLTTVLVLAFFENSMNALENGVKDIELKEILEKDVEKICEYIDSIAIPCNDELAFKVAKTSAHGDTEIAQIVSDAFIKAGENGIVSHKRSMTDETYIDFIEGNPIESGYSHEGFVNVAETQSVVFNDPLILCSLINFQTANEIIPFLEYASLQNRPLVVIGNMEHDVHSIMLSNKQNPNVNAPFCVIKPPYIGKSWRETTSDIALILGCEVLEGIPRVNYDGKEQIYLGTCKRIEIGKKDTVIYQYEDNDKSKINARIAELQSQIKHQKKDSSIKEIKERIAKLSGGISTIMVGGITPAETEERVARVDDAVCAVRSAKDGGVVAGGGIALQNASTLDGLNDITIKSIVAPYLKILSNAGNIPSDSIPMYKYPNGYDVLQYKEVNMIDEGIIDTAKGVKTALINAVSASNNLIRTNNIVTFKRMQNGK